MAAAMEISNPSIARGHRIKTLNAVAAAFCGGIPAALLVRLRPSQPQHWIIGLIAGILWANAFEYAYHRYLLHLPGSFFGKRHLQHHASIGTPREAEHVNLGGSWVWVLVMFAANGIPLIAADLFLRLGVAAAMLLGFSIYFVVVEEVHWRIHMRERLPKFLDFARTHHFEHHSYPDGRYNIFLPIFDRLVRPRAAH